MTRCSTSLYPSRSNSNSRQKKGNGLLRSISSIAGRDGFLIAILTRPHNGTTPTCQLATIFTWEVEPQKVETSTWRPELVSRTV
jgi:hypothetical protein